MKKGIFTAILLLFTISMIFGQQSIPLTKKFSGELKDDYSNPGIAVYNYYEKDYNFIKHGPFTFSYNSNGITKELKGQFKDGLRTGKWISTMSGRGVSVIKNGNFKNGLPHGEWTMTSCVNNIPYLTFDVNFNEGLIVGNFKFQNKKSGEVISGILNSSGYMQGEWRLAQEQEGYEYIQIYEDSCYILAIQREINSGKVSSRIDNKANAEKSASGVPVKNSAAWNPLSKNDIFGYYFTTHMWNGWDFDTVGGIKDNPVKGLYYFEFKKQQ